MFVIFRKARSLFRLLRNAWRFQQYRHATWLHTVRACQATVRAHHPAAPYFGMYGRRETGFWHTIAQWIVEDAPRLGVQRCLDVGSGYGTVALFCQRTTGAPAYCLDVIPLLAPELIAAEGLTFAQRNVELAPIPWPGTFEIVTFTEVIEHLFYHPRVALKHIATALAPHGRLYLSTPDAREWGRVTRFYASPAVMPMPGDPLNPALGGHVYQYTMDELLEIVTEAGFVVERQGYSLGGANRHLNLTLRKVTA